MIREKLLLPVLCSCLALVGCGGDAGITVNTNANSSNAQASPTASTANGNTQPTNSIPTNGVFPTNSIKSANVSVGNVSATPPPTLSQEDPKKDKALFSFPPPKVVDMTEIPFQKLANREGTTTFSDVEKKLVEALEKAGYHREKYGFFWNGQNEFAIVTKMERINADGTRADETIRWETDSRLPAAQTPKEYGEYLFRGKKVYYRIFAFIVTNRDFTFFEGTPPSFEMASKWIGLRQSSKLGGGGSAPITQTVFDNQYHCYVLLYQFVNHTSLDLPIPVNDEHINRSLITGLNKGAWSNLQNTEIRIGE